MKKLSSVSLSLIIICVTLFSKNAAAQLVGDNAFLQGQFVEAAVASNGSMGSNRIVPSGYHTRSPSFDFYDPGLGAFTGFSAARLMMTYDAGHDGWTSGVPVIPSGTWAPGGFFGDYSMPGTPYEAWSIQINGNRGDALFYSFGGTSTGYTSSIGTCPITGTVTGYTNSGGRLTGTWQGTAGTGAPLTIKQVFILDTAASWVRINVKFKNTSGSALPNVYYMRHVDPDNDQVTSGSFSTTNTIIYQNDYYHRVMVTAAGTAYTTQTLSMLTKDCRAKCFIGTGWPTGGTSLAAYHGGTGGGAVYTAGASNTGDYATAIVWNLGTINAGDSTELTMAYVYNGLLGLDSAVTYPKLFVNGVAKDSIDTVTACAFSADTLWANIINATTADWAGSTWTWAPSTYLLSTTGVTTGILASTMTSPVTYTITGTAATGGCAGKIFRLTVMPPGVTPNPVGHDTSFCQGYPSGPLTASAIGSLLWYTTPTGGVGSSTAPIPSTAVIGTTNYYVSQVVAGCSSGRDTVTVTILAPPAAITGTASACVGQNTTLACTTVGGVWSSSNTAVGTIGSTTGIVTGISPGTTTISYCPGSGCCVMRVVTIYPMTPAITITAASAVVCSLSNITFSNTLAGGTWSSSNPSIGSIDPVTGVATGTGTGVCTITYTTPGTCYQTRTLTVNPLPTPITGPSSVCVGTTITLGSTPTPGIWTSSTAAVGTVTSTTGIVTGISAGTTTISYRYGGCTITTIVTVISTPPAPTGVLSTCIGSCTTLSHATSGGTWSSSSTAVATVGSITTSTAAVCGVSLGTANITYAIGSSCYGVATVTVNAAPPAITGPSTVCESSCMTLSHVTTGGTWTSGTTSVATVGASTGVVCGVAPGTTTITYVLPSGCSTTKVITVNPLPGVIVGSYTICQGGNTTFTATPAGGTWSVSSSAIGTIGAASGVFTASVTGTSSPATVTISYTISTGCVRTAIVTVNPLPAAIGGTLSVCAGTCNTLTNSVAGGVWSSSTASVGTIDAVTGVICGLAPGTTTVSYTLSTGCYITAVVTVNSLPGSITGSAGTTICVGYSTTLSTSTAGGTWSGTCPGIASIGSSSGVVTGIAAGTCIVTFTAPTGCRLTTTITVVSAPTGITPTSVCLGASPTLTASITGGTWSSSNAAVGTVNATTGVFDALGTGTTVITYGLSSGCSTTAILTVNPLPTAITGNLSLCLGTTSTLSSGPGTITWTSSNPGVAPIVAGTGLVTGVAVGTSLITGTSSTTGCTTTAIVTVNPTPPAIGGTMAVCVGGSGTLTNATTGGTWSSGCPSVLSVGASSGVVSGIGAGTCLVTYTAPTGCRITGVVTVNALPTISPSVGGSVCIGSTLLLSGSPAGGTWASANVGVGTVGAATGIVGGMSADTVSMTYTLPTGCARSVVVTVNPLPATIGGSLATCVGSTTTATNATTSGSWSSACPSIMTINSATGVITGIGAGTCNITYTLSTGCRTVAVVTIYGLPGAISGSATVCTGVPSTYTSSTPGGTWSSTSPCVTVGSSSGIVTGVTGSGPCTATITYTLGTGCTTTKTITVNESPAAITGTGVVCAGSTTTLSTTTPGGTWLAPCGTASITSGGVVSGISAGTCTITYLVSTGCMASTIVTVTTAPTPVSGTLQVCVGQTTLLGSTPAGGTWSIAPTTVATVNPTTGLVYGVSAGTATVTYAIGTGCSVTAIVTVNPLPSIIVGVLSFSHFGTTTLSSSPTGGTWTIAPTTVATINPTSGVAYGVSPGTATVTYTLPGTGCSITTIVTVNPLPADPTGDTTICMSSTGTLTCLPAGGTWTSSNLSVATIGLTTGIFNGVAPGTSTITYTLSTGAFKTKVVTVYPLPTAITGTAQVCVGLTTTLSTTTIGGSWTSSNTAVATISAGGVVSGISAGTAVISYAIPPIGCFVTRVVTVNPLPAPISGSSGFCNFTQSIMSSSTPGGAWTSSDTMIAKFVGSSATTGTLEGVNMGSVTITYTLPTGCITTKPINIIFAPYAITGPTQVCQGSSITLSNIITGGSWSSTNTAVGTITSGGVVTGITGGTTTISYQLSTTGCATELVVTVHPLPTMSGIMTVCEQSTTTLTGSPAGGTWTSSNPAIGTVDPSTGVVAGIGGGVFTTTYTLGTGCFVTGDVTVNPLPAAITGTTEVCVGATTTLSSTTPGGNWSSDNLAVATVDLLSGVVTGSNPGTVNIYYTLPTTCEVSITVTVNPLPAMITGTMSICQGDNSTLSISSTGGTWSSSNPAVAPVDAFGNVFGLAAGTATIYYTLASGCASVAIFTVNPVPAGVSGSLQVCAGFSSNLTTTPTGGTWAQTVGTTAIGVIHPLTGVVTGITPGTFGITYTLPGTGCNVTDVVTVNPLPPAIGGIASVCVAKTTTLTNTEAGGTWSSANTSIATVGLTDGAVTGVAGPALVNITYTSGVTGCINLRQVTVNPLPNPITGTLQVCEGSTTTLSSTTPGGAWTSSTPAVGTIGVINGVAMGISAGTTGITYTILATGCETGATLTVNPTPPAIVGWPHICFGSPRTLSNTMGGGSWSSSDTTVVKISSAGVMTGISLGTSIITYKMPVTGCMATKVVTVWALPNVYTVSGDSSYCAGGNGVPVFLSGSQLGVSYLLYFGSSATGYMTGTGLPLNFGLHTVAGVYTVLATHAISGCTQNMAGSATITINPLITPTVNVAATPGDSVCPGTPVNFTPITTTGGTAPSYTWKVNGVMVSTAPSYSFIPADGDVVSVKMISNLNCVMPDSAHGAKTMHVLPWALPLASVNADPGDTVCQFTLTNFTANATYGGSAPVYTWMVNGTIMGTGSTFSYVPDNGDIVNVRMVSNYLCRLDDTVMSGNVAMVVDSLIVPHVIVTPHPGYSVHVGEPVTLTTTVANAGPDPKYQWTVNGVPVLGATLNTYTSTFNHYDSVGCLVTSSGVCKDITTYDWAFINVAPLGVNTVATVTDIHLMPNPNKGTFTIRGTWGTTDEEITAEVTNMLGQVVFSGKVMANNGKINEQILLHNSLANGMYMLNLKTATENKVFHFVMEQ